VLNLATTQRITAWGTEVHYFFSEVREKVHYAPKAAWNEGFGRVGREIVLALLVPVAEQQRAIGAAEAE